MLIEFLLHYFSPKLLILAISQAKNLTYNLLKLSLCFITGYSNQSVNIWGKKKSLLIRETITWTYIWERQKHNAGASIPNIPLVCWTQQPITKNETPEHCCLQWGCSLPWEFLLGCLGFLVSWPAWTWLYPCIFCNWTSEVFQVFVCLAAWRKSYFSAKQFVEVIALGRAVLFGLAHPDAKCV